MEQVREGYLIDYISGQELKATPEEIQAVQPFVKKLCEDYGYPMDHIQTRPQWHVKARPSDTKKEYPVDIAVFSSNVHSDENIFMIVECKKKSRKDGRSQLEDYLRFSNAFLGVWFNGEETLYIRKYYKANGTVNFIEIPNIPLFGQRIEDIGLFKRRDLKRTHNLKSVFNSIRNYLAANNTGITLDTEFVSQIINLIFCKIYDERFKRPDDMVDFRAGIDENVEDVSKRIVSIFDLVKAKYPDVFTASDVITLSDSSIAYIAGELQQYCLVESERDVIADAYDRLIAPAIEREIRNDLSEKAEDGAIKVFGKNLEQLLMQPPIKGQVVLGWDPAFRTGCKLAVVDETGKVLDTTVIYPTAPQNKVEEAKVVLKKLISKYHITLISLGNGTASRESEQIIVQLLKEIPVQVQYIIVNEAGASVYSASKLATEEFPNFDVGQRSATSMARRLQDPLAELVKIDPKSIGVGQYQHDMNQKKLSEALSGVVEDCVNRVGVDLNTASASLLEYISGISKAIAKNIVTYREENGAFTARSQLLKVAKLGPKAYEQSAGFMRISDGKNPLDATGVHPESYAATKALLEKMGYTLEDVKNRNVVGISKKIRDYKKLAEELEIGELTLRDIVKELEKPARDPRDDMPKPILRSDVLEMKDLTPGMVLKGTVRNVIDFGAFVDIGVHQDGLVHISQMCDRYIKHPLEVVSVGDIVEVKVLSVDLKKQRIQLTMKM